MTCFCTVYADKTQRKEKAIVYQRIFSIRAWHSPQRKLSSFLEHNWGANMHDGWGLNLERKCFVTDSKTSRLSAIMFIFILLWSLVSEMDHRVVVCSLEEVCSFLVNMLLCSWDSCHPDISSLKASPKRVCSGLDLNFYFPGQECDIQWSRVRLKCTQLNN